MSKYPVEKSEEAWKQELSAEEYRILRQAGTEYPFTGQYNAHFEAGTYHCKGVAPHSMLQVQNLIVAAVGLPMTKH